MVKLMQDRRSVLSGLCATVVGGVLASVGVAAQSEGVSVDIRLSNDTDGTLTLSANEGFAGDPSEYVSGTGSDVEFSASVNADAQTTVDSPLRVENATDAERRFSLIDESGIGDIVDVKTGSTSVLVDSRTAAGSVPIGSQDDRSLSVVIDARGRDPGAINGRLSLVTEDDDTGGGSPGCVITTAASSEPETLQSLRRFRDDSMSQTPVGRGLLSLYYRIGPPIAATIDRHPTSRTRRVVRATVRRCATLADAKARSDSRAANALLGTVLIATYVLAAGVGLAGHASIRIRERLRTLRP